MISSTNKSCLIVALLLALLITSTVSAPPNPNGQRQQQQQQSHQKHQQQQQRTVRASTNSSSASLLDSSLAASSTNVSTTTAETRDQSEGSQPTESSVIVTSEAESPTSNETATELPNFTSSQDTSTFSCHGKLTGYYADVKLGCRVYHFCTQIDGIGGTSYQRMSYICLEGSLFDQKDLNCVKKSDLRVPCEEAEKEYDSSNRQFDAKEEAQPSMTDSLAANIMMNPLTRFIAGR